MKLVLYWTKDTSQIRAKTMYQTAYFSNSPLNVIDLYCGIVELGSILFIEMTAMNIPNQTKTTINVTKKYKIGTRISLFVLNKKSAAASITSIASLSDLHPHQIEHANTKAKIAEVIPPAIR